MNDVNVTNCPHPFKRPNNLPRVAAVVVVLVVAVVVIVVVVVVEASAPKRPADEGSRGGIGDGPRRVAGD